MYLFGDGRVVSSSDVEMVLIGAQATASAALSRQRRPGGRGFAAGQLEGQSHGPSVRFDRDGHRDTVYDHRFGKLTLCCRADGAP